MLGTGFKIGANEIGRLAHSVWKECRQNQTTTSIHLPERMSILARRKKAGTIASNDSTARQDCRDHLDLRTCQSLLHSVRAFVARAIVKFHRESCCAMGFWVSWIVVVLLKEVMPCDSSCASRGVRQEDRLEGTMRH